MTETDLKSLQLPSRVYCVQLVIGLPHFMSVLVSQITLPILKIQYLLTETDTVLCLFIIWLTILGSTPSYFRACAWMNMSQSYCNLSRIVSYGGRLQRVNCCWWSRCCACVIDAENWAVLQRADRVLYVCPAELIVSTSSAAPPRGPAQLATSPSYLVEHQPGTDYPLVERGLDAGRRSRQSRWSIRFAQRPRHA